MSMRFNTPVFRPQDNKGRTLPGAQLFFYENYSTTPKTTYANVALTNPNPHPIIADGAGKFTDIFLGIGDYRVILTDRKGQILWDRNDVSTNDLTEDVINDIERQLDEVLNQYRMQYLGEYGVADPDLEKTFTVPNAQYVEFNGFAYWTIPGTTLPYTTDSVTYPDPASDPNLTIAPNVTFAYVDTVTNLGDSQLAGGNIFPFSSQESASTSPPNNNIPSGTRFLRSTSDIAVFEMIPQESGVITAIDFDAGTATVGGNSVTLVYINTSDNKVNLLDYVDDVAEENGDNYIKARDIANSLQLPLFMGNGRISWDLSSLSEPVEMPAYGVRGEFNVNVDLITTTLRERILNEGQLRFASKELTVSGAQYNTFDNVIADAINIDGGGDINEGAFWNIFTRTTGRVNIDTGNSQSINQNFFYDTRGGLHIFGGTGAIPQEECDQNLFIGLDTTNAQIGPEGWHVLNESFLDQKNTLMHVYMEGAGNKAIKGNFNTIRTYSDGASTPYATPASCWHIFNGDVNTRNANDFIPANPKMNAAEGGLWDKLDARREGQPVCMSTGSFTGQVVAGALERGFNYKYGGTTNIDFSSINIQLSNSFSGAFGVYIIIQVVQGNISLQFNRTGSPLSLGSNVFWELPNNQRLYKLSGTPVRSDGANEVLTVFLRTVGGVAEAYVTGVWASPEKALYVPSPVHDSDVYAITSTGIIGTVPDALPVSGRIKNTNPNLNAGQTVEWVKDQSGSALPIITI